MTIVEICFTHPSLFNTIYRRVSLDFYSGFLLVYFMNVFVIWLGLFWWITDFRILKVNFNCIIWSFNIIFLIVILFLLLLFFSCSSILMSSLPQCWFEAIKASVSLLTVSFLDCNSLLVMLLNKARVWLIISSFDLSSSCRCLIWLLSEVFDFTTKSSHPVYKNLVSLPNNFLMSSCKLYKNSLLNLKIWLFS